MRLWPVGLPVIALLALAGCSSNNATAGGSPNGDAFPPSIYPRPASFPNWGSPNGCASLKNVASSPRNPRRASLRVLSQWGHISKTRDLHLSDRAEWPTVREDWAHGSEHSPPVDLRSNDVVQGPGARSPYANLVRNNCGQPLLDKSWWVAVCPGQDSQQTRCTLRTEPALIEHFMLLSRRRHLLVWFTNP